MPVKGSISSKNETAILLDAMESLKSLHQKSRPRTGVVDITSTSCNVDTNTSISSKSASEHRRKIRELTIALEAQAMDETKHFALVSPCFMTRAIATPRVTIVSPNKPKESELKAHPEEAIAPSTNLDQANTTETDNQSRTSMDLEEQMKIIGNLTRELDAQLNAARQAQALYKKNPYAARVGTEQAVAERTDELVVIEPVSDVIQVQPVEDVEKAPCMEKDVTSAKTESTELETVDASAMKADEREAPNKENELSVLVNKEDFESEHTDFEAALSPTSFFVKYGEKSPSMQVSFTLDGRQISPQLEAKEHKKAVIKNAAILSRNAKDANKIAEEKKWRGTMGMLVSYIL